jgi:hypothetical protein
VPISFSQWRDELRQNWTKSPASALLQAGYYTYLGAWLTATSHPRLQLGTNIYDRADEWELLIVLDACRVDALRAVAPEYDFLPPAHRIESVWSLASASIEWLCKTFTTDHSHEIARTAYLSANPYADHVFYRGVYAPPKAAPFGWPRSTPVTAGEFALLYRLYEHCCDERVNVVLPGEVTDATIAAGRANQVDADRYIAHYMQPHKPYYATALTEGRPLLPSEDDPWTARRDGTLTGEDLWTLYLDTLRDALDSIAVLLRNIDAERVVITADHGEMLGTWGIGSHPTGCPHPTVKKVPWAPTTAADNGTYEPHSPVEGDTQCRELPAEQVEGQLSALGYT